MLRATVTGASWRLSSGTAAVAGLANARLDCAPTTAYVLLGERCSADCAFCAQARSSAAGADRLSRVAWPAFGIDRAATAIARACDERALRRICFQVTTGPGYLDLAIDAVRSMRARTTAPICTSVAVRSLDDIAALIEAGASRVTLAIDAACERIYLATKTGSWQRTEMLLSAAARAYPGQMGTHLIVGLGETEREMAQALQRYADLGLAAGLFAFTPIVGTRLGSAAPPDPGAYRRLQAVRWLIVNRLASTDDLRYDEDGRLVGLGLPAERLLQILSDPVDSPFRTSGCTDCNRPYYNERPGSMLYNYPRPLTLVEARSEAGAVVRTLG